MAAGNNAQYVTTQGCSTGLSVGCPVAAADGWYYDGGTGYAYYVSNGAVSSIDTNPCYVAPPPPPPPASYDYYDYENCQTYPGPSISIAVIQGDSAPLCIYYNGDYYTKYDGPADSPTYTTVSYSTGVCNCN